MKNAAHHVAVPRPAPHITHEKENIHQTLHSVVNSVLGPEQFRVVPSTAGGTQQALALQVAKTTSS